MYEEVLIAGAGGQGTLVMGEVLALGNLEHGNYSTWQPTYGSAKRGGEANCGVVLSDKEIICPNIEFPNILVCFNQDSFDRLADTVPPDGIILINSDEVKNVTKKSAKIYAVPAGSLAVRENVARSVNILMLGALLAIRPLIDTDQVEAALRKIWGDKKADKLLPVNLKALAIGRGVIEQ